MVCSMEIPWANIGEFLKAAVPSIIAGIVAWVGIQNWITAKNKLALDLFDRRIKAWTDLERCFQAALIEAEKTYLDGDEIVISTSTMIDFARVESNAHWLFGEPVRLKINEVAYRIVAMTAEQADDKFDTSHRTRAAQFNNVVSRPSIIALGQLRRMAEPYMMLDRISVNRPARPFHWLKMTRRKKAKDTR